MDEKAPLSRRRYLALMAASGLGGLAGCSEQAGPSQPTSTTFSTVSQTVTRRTEPPSETPTDEVEETETPDRWEVEPVEHDKLIGAHYLQWYRGDEGIEGSPAVTDDWTQYTPLTPALGSYHSLDKVIINQQVKWALEHGINWFITSGYANLRQVWTAELADEMQWSILIGGVRFESNERGAIDFSREENREKLIAEVGYMADNYFDDPKYLEIDGRPVIYLYGTSVVGAGFEDAVAAAENRAGYELYWIADYPQYQAPAQQERALPLIDALSTFTPYRPIINDGDRFTDMPEFVETAEDRLATRRLAADDMDYTFIPTVTPGYNDHHDARKISSEGRDPSGTHPILERDPDIFEDYGRTAIDYMDPERKAIIISTWGGWLETTQIEPTVEHGTAFIESARDGIAKAEPDFIDTNAYRRLSLDFNQTELAPQPRERHWAFRLHGVQADDRAVFDYRIGPSMEDHVIYNLEHPDRQVHFSEGCYPPFGNEEITPGRWLGGDTGTASLYLDPALDLDTVVLTGRPINPDMTARVHFNGQDLGELRFDDGPGDYIISSG